MRPSRAKDVVLDVDFDLLAGRAPVRIHIEDGKLHAVSEPAVNADLVVRAELGTLADLADGSLPVPDALAGGSLVLEGSDEVVRTYQRLFPQPAVPSAR